MSTFSRTLSSVFAALAIALLPQLVTAAPLPEAVAQHIAAQRGPHKPATCANCCQCRCHTKGYPHCDCGQGDACRCVILGQYAHLPNEPACKASCQAAGAWRIACEEQAAKLGYLAYTENNELWDGNRWVWIGGGWHATQLRQEIEEAKQLEKAWLALWWIQWPGVSEETRREWEITLREQIGDTAFFSGRMPSCIPFWRVPRVK